MSDHASSTKLLIVGAAALGLLLVAVAAAIVVERRADAEKRVRTLETLGLIRAVLARATVHPLPNNDSWHEALHLALDWRSKRARLGAGAGDEAGGWTFGAEDRLLHELLAETTVLRDAWGQPLHYRSPGPVHKEGWDVYSVGPSGRELPDPALILGEDLPPLPRS
jgi:hypothetical protein